MINLHHWLEVATERRKRNLPIIDTIKLVKFEWDKGPAIMYEGKYLIIDLVYLEWWDGWKINIMCHNSNYSSKIINISKFICQLIKLKQPKNMDMLNIEILLLNTL